MQYGFYLTVTGKVQGVGYRRWFAEHAQAQGLKGYVKNLANGEVEAVIFGERAALQQMLDQSLLGPKEAQVNYLNYQSSDDDHYADFQMIT